MLGDQDIQQETHYHYAVFCIVAHQLHLMQRSCLLYCLRQPHPLNGLSQVAATGSGGHPPGRMEGVICRGWDAARTHLHLYAIVAGQQVDGSRPALLGVVPEQDVSGCKGMPRAQHRR